MWFLLYICVCVEGFLCRCVHCVNTNLQTPSFFCLQVWVYTECATWRQQGHSFGSLINIDTVCILCVGVQQRHTHVCLSLCDWLHWDFVQTELRFSLALLSVCVNAHVSVRVWLQCVRFRFFVTFSQCLCCVNAWLPHPDHLICTTCTGFGWRQQRFSSLFNVKVPVVSLLSVHAIYSTSHYAYSIYPSTHRGWLCTVICLSFTFSLYVYV